MKENEIFKDILCEEKKLSLIFSSLAILIFLFINFQNYLFVNKSINESIKMEIENYELKYRNLKTFDYINKDYKLIFINGNLYLKSKLYLINKKIVINFSKNMIFFFYLLIFLNILYIILLYIFYKFIFNHLNNIKEKLKILNEINFNNEKNLLDNNVIIKIAEHLHHEIKPPLLSLKNALIEYNMIIQKLIEAADPKGKRSLDIIVYSNNHKNCENCKEKGKYAFCNYFNSLEKNLFEKSKELQEYSSISLNQIFKTIQITKSLKTIKNTDTDINVYDVIEQNFKIMSFFRKYKFIYEIDKKLKNCFLNGLSPEIFTNILINHIKNSLEAGSTIFQIKFISYFEDPELNKNFVRFEFIDNGSGIPKDKINNIYDLNFSTKGDSDNNGFGLYITKQLLQQYQGNEILKYTKENHGTIFCIKLPVKYCTLKKDKKSECVSLV